MIFAQIILYIIFFCFLLDIDRAANKNSRLSPFNRFLLIVVLESARIYFQSNFGDIQNYKFIFNETPSLYNLIGQNADIPKSIEPGFFLFTSIIKTFSNNYFFYLFVISLWHYYAYFKFFKKFGINNILGYLVVYAVIYVSFYIGMLRQSLAMTFFLLGLIKLEKSIFLYLGFILIAVSFHISSIFCLALFWVNKLITPKYWIILSFFAVGIYILSIDLISNTLISIRDILDIGNIGRILFYLDVDRPNNYLGIGFWERIILLIITIYSFSIYYRTNSTSSKKNIIFNLAFTSIFLQLFFFASPTITSRIRYFVMIFPVIVTIHVILSNRLKVVRFATIPLFLFYLSFQLFFQGNYLL